MKFLDHEELQRKVDAYFDQCFKEVGRGKNKRKIVVEHPTITGLADWLDTDRITLLRYESVYNEDLPEICNTIKAAKARIEKYMEQILLSKSIAAGVIFSLKNNFLWRDERDLNLSGDLKIEATVEGVKITTLDD